MELNIYQVNLDVGYIGGSDKRITQSEQVFTIAQSEDEAKEKVKTKYLAHGKFIDNYHYRVERLCVSPHPQRSGVGMNTSTLLSTSFDQSIECD